MSHPRNRARAGFAAPLAVSILIAVSLLALLLMEGALGEVRMGAAMAAEARVMTSAESALAQALARRLDTTVFSRPAGALVWQQVETARDSVLTRIQILGGAVARVTVSARSRDPRLRVFVGIRAFVTLVSSPSVAGEVVMAPLGPDWWIAGP